MRRSKLFMLVAYTLAGTVFGGGCTDAFRTAAVSGALDFVSQGVNSALSMALPLDLFLPEFIRDVLGPSV